MVNVWYIFYFQVKICCNSGHYYSLSKDSRDTPSVLKTNQGWLNPTKELVMSLKQRIFEEKIYSKEFDSKNISYGRATGGYSLTYKGELICIYDKTRYWYK